MLKKVPAIYLFERLAQRWSVPPYQLERELDDPLVQRWVRRGLIFQSLEAVEVKHGRR